MTIEDLIWEWERGSINSFKLVEQLKEVQADLKKVSSEDLRQELRLRGYQTDNLWHTEDVMQNYDCESEVAMEILELAMNNDWVIENIFSIVDEYAETNFNLKNKNQ